MELHFISFHGHRFDMFNSLSKALRAIGQHMGRPIDKITIEQACDAGYSVDSYCFTNDNDAETAQKAS